MKRLSSLIKKKYLFLTVLFLLSAQEHLFAQNNTSFGLKAGVNISTFYGADVEGNSNTPVFDSKTGITLGIFYKMPINPLLSYQAELFYSEKGAEINENEQEVYLLLRIN